MPQRVRLHVRGRGCVCAGVYVFVRACLPAWNQRLSRNCTWLYLSAFVSNSFTGSPVIKLVLTTWPT